MRPLPLHGDRWSSSSFPAALPEATARLRAYVASHVDPQGAVRVPCRGRPLETALLSSLLRSAGQPFTRQSEYLSALPADSDPLDLAIAEAALGRGGNLTEVITILASVLPHWQVTPASAGVRPKAVVTLRPHRMPVTVHRRRPDDHL